MTEEIKMTKSRGPKPSDPPLKAINVMLTEEHRQIARALGRGSISQGVRVALEKAIGGGK